jgi:short-subunit dehydrogenase
LLIEGVRIFAVSLEDIPLQDLHLCSYICDLSKKENVIKSFNQAIKEMGTIDIYIANAGQARYGLSTELDQASKDLMMDLNVHAVIQGLELMKELRKDQPFTFVATSSVMAFWPLPGYAYYSATKSALSTYIKANRFEVNKDQRLTLVYPVATDTNFFQVSGQRHKSWMVQTPEWVAEKVIKGIKKGKKDIYPSFLFKFIHKYCRLLLKPYIKREIKILKQTKN